MIIQVRDHNNLPEKDSDGQDGEKGMNLRDVLDVKSEEFGDRLEMEG